MVVLIPTSGLGSRLGEISQHLNKALVRVGTKAVISHIIDSYPEDATFCIMLGHLGDRVREYVGLAHPTRKVIFLDLEQTEGNLGLIPALWRQKDLIPDEPLVFHAADTIIEDPVENWTTKQAVVGAITFNGHDYCTLNFREENHDLLSIYPKGENVRTTHWAHVGVVSFRQMEVFWNVVNHLATSLEREAGKDYVRTLSDVAIVEAMLGEFDFDVVETDTWWDTGNVSALFRARGHFYDPKFVTLEKTDQAVYMVGDRIIKFFADAEKVDRLVKRAKYLGDAVPEILGQTQNFFAYQKAEGQLVRDTMFQAQFFSLLEWCQDTLWTDHADTEGFQDAAHAFYFTKTVDRLGKFYAQTGLTDQEDIINGERIPPLGDMLELLNWGNLVRGIPCRAFHGDLHFSNILMDDMGEFTLLDWRDGFGGGDAFTTEFGDVYYDLGKLLHGLIVSHDCVDSGKFSIKIEEQVNLRAVTFDIVRHHRHVECERLLEKWCLLHDYNLAIVRCMCALIFLNIAALHHEPYNRFLYFLGKRMIFDLVS